jgi:ferrous iron transport protein B
MKSKGGRVALVGNPNSGKSSVFNLLTGLRQKVSNYPGVTVDKKEAKIRIGDNLQITLADLPGCYSLYPNSSDERIVADVLCNAHSPDYPDLVLYVADSTQLERHLLLASQIADLGFPMIFVLNMIDLTGHDSISIDIPALQRYLSVPVIPFSGRTKHNVSELKQCIAEFFQSGNPEKWKTNRSFYTMSGDTRTLADDIQLELQIANPYLAKILAHHHTWIKGQNNQTREKIKHLSAKYHFSNLPMQVQETMSRFQNITDALRDIIKYPAKDNPSLTDKIDRWITHRWIGPVLYFFIMFWVFQAIFSWSTYPMDLIENFFAQSGTFYSSHLPQGWFSDLLVNGVWAGLGGVVVFVPQIAILFLLISILEESGYMSRAVFLFDGLMQRFGMNGRSVVALISSGACAIPAIMSTRTISNFKERLITILVSPFISCSARIPVYAILTAFVVPADRVLGIFSLRGLVFTSLYVLGIIGALAVAFVLKKVLHRDGGSSLVMELPVYKAPVWQNVWINVRSKVMAFITEAGKIIVLISVILWFLASFGPGDSMQKAESKAVAESALNNEDEMARENLIAAYKIEASYAGLMGKWIEPVISPLGFDWKIGIAIITSFAAREVFVGTMATIYSIGSAEDEITLRQRMARELKQDGLTPRFDAATSMALLVFYVFALQCMSTLAVVRKETGSWKWPLIQFLIMGVMAYLGAYFTYQFMS